MRTKLVSIGLKFNKIAFSVFFIVFFIVTSTTFGQKIYQFTLVDKSDALTHLPYVTIYNKNTEIRKTTDINGVCVVTGAITDSIHVTRLGYVSLAIKLGDVKEKETLYMVPVVYSLAEVKVKPRPPILDVLKKCKLNLEKSDNGRSYEQTAFLKERVVESNSTVGYFDAFVKIYNGGYSKKYEKEDLRFMNSDLISIRDFRRSKYPSYFTIDNTSNRYSWINIPNVLTGIYEKKRYLHRKIFEEAFFRNFNFEYSEILQSEDGTQDVYEIKFSMKEEVKQNAISSFLKNKSNILFTGKFYITTKTFELVGFNIDQTEYQDIIWKSFPGRAALNLTVKYLKIENNNLLNSIELISSYKKDNLQFEIFTNLNIENEAYKELSEDEIRATYGTTSIYKGIRIQGKPLRPNPYNAAKWEKYNYLLSPKIRGDIQKQYGISIDNQFSTQNTIYTNIK